MHCNVCYILGEVTSWEMQTWDSGVVGDLSQHVVAVGVDAKWLPEISSSASCSNRVP